MRYQVWGDRDTDSEAMLFDTAYLGNAMAWAREYVRFGDFGGYDTITVFEQYDNEHDNGRVHLTISSYHWKFINGEL